MELDFEQQIHSNLHHSISFIELPARQPTSKVNLPSHRRDRCVSLPYYSAARPACSTFDRLIFMPVSCELLSGAPLSLSFSCFAAANFAGQQVVEATIMAAIMIMLIIGLKVC